MGSLLTRCKQKESTLVCFDFFSFYILLVLLPSFLSSLFLFLLLMYCTSPLHTPSHTLSLLLSPSLTSLSHSLFVHLSLSAAVSTFDILITLPDPKSFVVHGSFTSRSHLFNDVPGFFRPCSDSQREVCAGDMLRCYLTQVSCSNNLVIMSVVRHCLTLQDK